MRESNAEHQAVTAHHTATEPKRAGPPPTEPLGGSSNLRRALLLRLRHDGPSSPEDLATGLGVSRTGVLQQLHALETSGLVSRQAVRHGVGRPRHVYDVTAAAQDLFPTNYDGLASGLLAAIRAIGGEDLVDGVFDERRRISGDRIRQRMAERLSPAASLVDRARELAVIQDEQGYLAEATIGADGVIRLIERNCAIHRVAADNGAACQAELDLFREILGPDVERETHIAAGDRCCTYRLGSPSD
ncbi:MAG TPA: helix-turn-helix domain-containing protein [Methylomirabilota bacterium]|nr:helix-turn-helix domain-containing protein [Methylomirabilota bacterium]